MVLSLAEGQSRLLSNTIKILYRHGQIQRQSNLSFRHFTVSNIIKEERPISQDGSSSTTEPMSSSSGEISRDMSSTAESSRSASSNVTDLNDKMDEDKQYAEIFATLNENWPKSNTELKPHKPKPKFPPRPESIASKLTFDGFSTPSPRHKGVHSRIKRSSGQTPKEAETFNEILAGIFADLNHPSSNNRNNLGKSMKSNLGIKDPYLTIKSGSENLNYGMINSNNNSTLKNNAKNLRKWLGESEESEENLQFLEEFEMLKEEMEVISSDIELIEWAKSRIFKPLTEINKDKSIQDTNTLTPIITYPPTYPKILAHLLRTLRVNYNSPHLVLSLFQHAKTCSLESYLSGCLTEVYNEILTVRWESFRDLIGVEQGIREMEIMGVNWDQITSKLISKIVEEVSKDLLSSSENQPIDITSILSNSSTSINENSQGFENLANITKNSIKQNFIFNQYGENVLIRLNRLDERVSKDVKKQEKYYELTKKRKRQIREERERKAQRERRQNEEFMGVREKDDKQKLGWIGEPKDGERAFI
ncbi:uncharacterized protein I206_104704 [Kwoniella pini CBS 10737]|uniref:Mtf2-like C-terminal domain-containing protein n=1 Tax=Kwoniella pini CBS 10737 TaxID=1296096 RepID=A0A1B9I7N1_9TREE|nr:uncharacterized protein I206_02242 [Kwoniella pini CBS 10737]OCF51528.1 hypothetical protein I206_02242 [Kwoniella pini CBS 10737]